MKIDALIEQENIQTIVIYPGRFQPPHIGHAKTYQMLAKKYGAENTYIATSNKTDGDKSPFDFAEKKALLAAAGVPADKIVQVVNTYGAKEITDQYDLTKTRVFYAVGAKDMAEDPRFKSFVKKDGTAAYIQKLEGAKNIETADKHAYLIVAPTVEFTVNGKPFTSASEFRQAFKNANPAEQAELAQQLYGAGAQKVLPILQKKLFKTEEEAIRESIEQMWLEAKRRKRKKKRAAYGGYWPYYYSYSVDSGAGAEGGDGGVGEGVTKADLDVPTPTVKELADKYRVTVPKINHALGKGIKVEMEHTTDVEIAREIALDHLAERLDYYDLLAKVEKSPEKVNELANEPYRYMLWKRTMMGNSYIFQTDGGQEMVVSIVPETLADGRHRVEVMFADKKDFGLEKTGKGDAFRIFATVAQVLKDYISQAKFTVDEIFFSGKTKEPSRIKLYDKIARRLGNYIQGFEFVGAGESGADKGYYFQKPIRNADEEVIKEVTMNPSALANFAKTDVAKAMTVGFEAEMAIEGMEDVEPDYDDVEPDWDADEDISFDRSWRQQVERFFTGGDGNNSRREVERALEKIDEDYMEWIEEQYQEWLNSDESVETITKKLKEYDEDISDEDIEDTIKFKKNNYWGSIEDDVREEWNDDNMNDDAFIEFMEYNDMDSMRGILDRVSGELSWPYYTEPEYGSGVSYEEIEMSFVETTGYKATVSSGYHSATRKPGVWIFEPDSSIEPAGVELVSPPMPLDEGLEALDKFFAWAKDYGAEANQSTGFHMGVSIPGQTMENIDHLKLIIFLGDEYVLSQFGRSNNSFTKSSLAKIRAKIDNGEIDALEVMNAFKQGLNSEAAKMMGEKLLSKGNRYVSVNIKENYIEFRSAGGNYFEKIPEIKNTMLRYVRAMAIAADPQAEKNEYVKKLYKMLSDYFPKEFETIKFFSKYASGQFNRQDLKDVLQSVQQGRADLRAGAKPAAVKEPAGMQTFTVTYRDLNGNEGQVNVKAENIVTAYNVFAQKYPAYIYKDIKLATNATDAERQRQQAAAASNMTAGGQPQWEVYLRNGNRVLHRFSAPDQHTAWTQGGAWARANGYGDRLEQLSVRQAAQQNESRKLLDTLLEDEQQVKEITQNPSVWNRFAQSDKASTVMMGFEAEMVVKGLADGDKPKITRNNNPPFPDIRTKEGQAAFVEFWTQNDAQTKKEAVASWKAILRVFKEGEWNIYTSRPSWKSFLYEFEISRMADLVYHGDEDFRMVWPFGMQTSKFTKEDLQKDFESATGYKVVVSDEYHGDDKPRNAFVFEPDSSIKAKANEMGQELVSPPMPLPKAMEALNKVYDWIANSGYVYTNTSTGFHVNVSMKGTKLANIDQMKLLLLIGDQHILAEFKRQANEYCSSLLTELKNLITDMESEQGAIEEDDLEELIAAMRGKTWEGLRKIANSFVGEAGIDEKYMSVHSHGKYIEFRSPGGDWVNNRESITNTVLRLTHAYTVAADPEEGRTDYLKKAYALIAGGVKDDELKAFIDYSMGNSNAKNLKAQLKKKWAGRKGVSSELKAFEITYKLFSNRSFSRNPDSRAAIIHAVDRNSAENRMLNIIRSSGNYAVIQNIKPVKMQPETLLAKGRATKSIPTAQEFQIAYQNPRTGRQETATVTAYTDQDAKEIWNKQFNASNIYKVISVQPVAKEEEENLDEMLKQVKGKWALVSRQNPKKVLQYYHGHGKPSEDWVNKVERRVQAFKHMEEATEPKPFVFVDMDGVLADFFGEWAKLDGKDHYKDIEHKEGALDLIRKHPTFWTKLPLLPHAMDLLHFIKKHYGEYYILSKPLEGDPRSEPGKRAWIREHLQNVMPERMIFTADKQRYAYVGGRPNILIDDFGKNIDLWKMNGGIGIKYRPHRYQETIKILRGLAR